MTRRRNTREEPPLISMRTAAIALVLMGGVIAVPVFMRGREVQRNKYATLRDCEAEYGSQAHCKLEQPWPSGSGSYYAGRWYVPDANGNDPALAKRSEGAQTVMRADGASPRIGVERGVRGGFGSTGRVNSISS